MEGPDHIFFECKDLKKFSDIRGEIMLKVKKRFLTKLENKQKISKKALLQKNYF